MGAVTRLHNKNEYSGTGVGLSIVKKVLLSHKGYIRAQGKPGEGSAFQIYLPTTLTERPHNQLVI